MVASQKRSLVSDQADFRSVNAELDRLHKRVNEASFPAESRVLEDYTATSEDKRLALFRSGLTITLPALSAAFDKFQIFIIDKSLDAETSPHTILPNAGRTIGGEASLSIAANGGSYLLQWDATQLEWFITNSNSVEAPVTVTADFYISTYMVSAGRVIVTPTALGQYTSYIRTAGTLAYTVVNGDPTAAPSAADGALIYRGAAWAGAATINQPTKYEIFVGVNKKIIWEFYLSAGRTGNINIIPSNVNVTTLVGYSTSYDPTTGIAIIVTPVDSASTTTPYTGRNSVGALVTTDVYFDIKVFE